MSLRVPLSISLHTCSRTNTEHLSSWKTPPVRACVSYTHSLEKTTPVRMGGIAMGNSTHHLLSGVSTETGSVEVNQSEVVAGGSSAWRLFLLSHEDCEHQLKFWLRSTTASSWSKWKGPVSLTVLQARSYACFMSTRCGQKLCKTRPNLWYSENPCA